MKAPQRNFVVEFKSSRRRLEARPASIWNDTDLRTIVQKAQIDAPHLFENSAVPATDHLVENARSKQALVVVSNHIPKLEADRTGSRGAEEIDLPDGGDNGSSVEDLQTKPAPVAKQQRVKSGRTRTSTGSDVWTKAPSGRLIEKAANEDELTALEKENHQLKVLLIAYLRQQNAVLRTMLLRFKIL
jgi:hypothetical protein